VPGSAGPGTLRSIEINWLSTRDDVRLTTRRWSPPAPGGTAVVLVHGFSATKDDPALGAVAEALCADGHLVVSYTARGHGDSEGFCTLGDLEHLDVEAAVMHARQDADRVVLVGASMGAIAVLRHASEADPDGVVTVSSPAEWRVPRTAQSFAAALLTQTPPGRWLARTWMNVRLAEEWSGADAPIELAARIRAPLAVIHGRADRFIRHDEAQKLFRAAAGPRRLHLIEGMGHAYMPQAIPAIRESVAWTLLPEHRTHLVG
jgi:alpha-beta hydrolase superfamily lysophospholipase